MSIDNFPVLLSSRTRSNTHRGGGVQHQHFASLAGFGEVFNAVLGDQEHPDWGQWWESLVWSTRLIHI